MKVKSESEVTQSCPTLSDPMDCSPPGSSVHGSFQARVLEWGARAKFIPRYLILFVAMVNGIDSLISLSDFSLLVYRNSSDFCVLISYSSTLSHSLISCSNFLTLSVGFYIYRIMSSANNESFIPFQFVFLLFLFLL